LVEDGVLTPPNVKLRTFDSSGHPSDLTTVGYVDGRVLRG